MSDVSLVGVRAHGGDFARCVVVVEGARAEGLASSEGETEVDVVLVVVGVLEGEKVEKSRRQAEGDDLATEGGIDGDGAAEEFEGVEWNRILAVEQRRTHGEEIVHQDVVQLVGDDFFVGAGARGDVEIHAKRNQELVDELEGQETSLEIDAVLE